jgi:hypothetical protein
MDEIVSRPIWPRRNVSFVTLFLYGCFFVSVFVIPDSISSGESLSFAFTFSMMQMVEVALFMRFESLYNFLFLVLSLSTACVLPTLQIFLVMQGEYSVDIQNICGYIYMFKELMLFFMSKGNLDKRPNLHRAHILVLSVWGVFEAVFIFIESDFENEKNSMEKLMKISRLTPLFCMAFFTLLRMTKGS